MGDQHPATSAVLLLAAMLAVSSCSESGPRGRGALPDALREARDNRRLLDNTNASEVANHFIPSGTDLNPAMTLLAASGFEISPMVEGRPRQFTGEEAFIATQHGPSHDLCDEEWRILLDSRSGRIIQTSAYIFQHCL